MRLNNIKLIFLFVVLTVFSNPSWALDITFPKVFDEPKPEPAEAPPNVMPYQIPTMRGKKRDFHHIPPIKLAPALDADGIFQMVVNCFPERPQWGLEVKAVTGARITEGRSISTFDTAGLSKYYAGIVAEMPLYSTDELNKVRTQEYNRRQDVAKNVSALLKAVANRQRALRMVGIAESIEARSQIRVAEDLAPAEEQIANLEKVAQYVGDLDAANSEIVAARLALAGQCRSEEYERVNEYLTEITK